MEREALAERSGDFMAKMYYDDDADLSLIRDRNVAIVGYGSQVPRARAEPEGQRRERSRRLTRREPLAGARAGRRVDGG